MGRKAKLRQQRKHPSTPSPDSQPGKELHDPQHFIDELKQQGYSLEREQTAPDLPDRRPHPQL